MSTNFGVGKVTLVQETQTLVEFFADDRRQEQWIPNAAFEPWSINSSGEEGEIVLKDDFVDGSNTTYPRVRLGAKLHGLRTNGSP
jgi:hypothetical protein